MHMPQRERERDVEKFCLYVISFYFVCICIPVSVYAHEYRCLQTVEMVDPMELELWVILSYAVWVLRTKLRFSAGAVCALDW